ncbi:NUDIX domain-containing protein [Corynebacterium aurimucosum]|uniref:NUDIX domain-containing protein n=1 Tax=Corynebacterium intestinale TaxID=2943492 RepID=A0ABT0T6X0_9CORY|nr:MULTISPECIES: NUDIX domain-containing protein [Corynebacterium]HCT9179981.1 NUDIX domain-containing protein [Corynebacterium aurimucosum]MCL8492823.1 NUDIX domain-containing protein [Corynebacterium intestinale]MCP1389055.1 NUDIX domain-containing protein [Corynebacterium intestinale]MCZ9297673.1 NUDIX domain-containing protein [Corynebacterium hesseae]MTD98171.1 NUDIX domain-containing protein [Corynebacterium guaraldiae]
MSQSIHDSLDAIDPGETTGFNGARLAATVLLLRDTAEGLRVWIQERVRTMRNYPGHVVFPGGGVDPRDFPPRTWDSGELWAGRSVVSMARRMGVTKYKAHALVFAAARELFEEAGTLLAIREDGLVSDASRYHRERELLESHEISFTEFLEHNGMRVDADMFLPWSRWAGEDNNHWFDTFFFIGVLPEGQEPDGETGEADDAGWFDPQLVLDGWRAGLVRLAIPTWAQLKRLTSYSSVKEVLDDASFSDLRPIIGDPRDDERYREYFTTFPVNRI